MKPARSSLFSLNALHILNDGFYTSMLLFFPFLAQDLQINLTQAGLLGTLMNSLGMLCALPAGYLAMRIGGMKLLIYSAVLYGIGYIGMGLATSYLWLFPMFIVAGIGFSLFHPVSFALVTRFSPAKSRGRNMANFTAIGDIGKIGISSVLTFIVVAIGWRYTAVLYGAVAVLFGLVFWLFAGQKKNEAVQPAVQHIPQRIGDILAHPPFVFAMLTSFLDCFSSASLFVFLPFLLLSRGIDAALLGTFSAVFFVGSLLGKSALGRVSDRLSSGAVVIFSELLMVICIIILAQSVSIPVIILCSVVVGIFTKGTVPVIQTMISEASEHHGHFEKAFAVNALAASLALTISPVFLGFISDQWGIEAAFYTMAATAGLAVIPALLFRIWQPARV